MIGELIGRFHPLIVHMPIGIIIAAFMMELASRKSRWEYLQKAIPFVLQLAILFSVVAWFTGWIMPKEGEFDERLIGLHFWFAVGMTVSSVLTYVLCISKVEKFQKLYFPVFCITMILLTVTGHFGGSLTHGEDFLTKPLEEETVVVTDVNSLIAYAGIIEPIFKTKCFSCHNEGKKKGGLVMSTIELLKKGGDEGPILIAGDVIGSSLMQRIHLPMEDDDHMPPSGKKQLTQNEVRLLEWWIAEGASFKKAVGEINQTEQIEGILKGYEQSESSINTKGLKIIDQDRLNNFAQAGINVLPLKANSPLAFASMSRDTLIDAGKIKKLKSIAKNITELDLSFSNLDDGMMSQLSRFENLQTLRIQHTDVSSKGLREIEGLKHLSFLNLYGTSIDDEALKSLDKIKTLKSVYLWQTNVSKEAAKEYAENHPMVNLSYEVDQSIFGDAKLKPPIITADKDIFEDTMRVTLSLNFANVKVFYTLDGTAPDSTSTLYNGPFLIKKTADVKAISAKEGWGTSDPSEKLLIKAGHTIVKAELQKQPNKKYKAGGAKSLVDFKKGSTAFVDGKWLGYEGENLTATLDLGSTKSVSNVVISALEDTGSYIFYPKGIEVSSSIDGRNYKKVKSIMMNTSEGPTPPELKSFLLEFNPHEARYVRTKVLGTLKNPSWHAAPGASNWLFVDEILVN